MATHTPGPWKVENNVVEPSKGHRVRYIEATNGDGFVCQAWTPSDGNESKRDANARLIAAAPDLLAACEAALSTLAYLGKYPDIQDNLVSAIRKAKGE